MFTSSIPKALVYCMLVKTRSKQDFELGLVVFVMSCVRFKSLSKVFNSLKAGVFLAL